MLIVVIVVGVLVLFCLILLIIILIRPAKVQTDWVPELKRVEADLKSEFRNNRQEFSDNAKESRLELTGAIRDFKSEITQTFATTLDQNVNSGESLQTLIKNNDLNLQQIVRSAQQDFASEQGKRLDAIKSELREMGLKTVGELEKITRKIEEKLEGLATQAKAESKEGRESLSRSLKDFSLEQRTKIEDLQKEQHDLTVKIGNELEKIRNKVEERLEKLAVDAKQNNTESADNLKTSIKSFEDTFDKSINGINELQKEKFAMLEDKQNKLVETTEKKLEEMRTTVDEKLQKTLQERLGISFDLVSKQLESVQKGLGEMQTLAQDVGGLKKVLSNVKMRGGFGEVQLSLLLEQILAPEQYEANVRTKSNSAEHVEFAIKFPGKGEGDAVLWLPIDAKFPKDVYQQLQDAYDSSDIAQIETAQKQFESSIRRMAKSISEKYLDPPNTTDFAIMFLPFESIYSEVVRKASLLEELQRLYKIVVTGPTTLAAILNSFQMGFRTLIIQKRSSEVWKILGAVKKEFENFAGLLDKAQKNLQTASNQIDEVMGKRTRAIQRKLKGVEMLDEANTKLLLPDITTGDSFEEEETP